MQVLLKKEALFVFDESKYTRVPSEVFDNMVESSFPSEKGKKDNIECEVMYFKNMRDYDDYNYNTNKNIFDKTKDVFISQKGEVFVFCKVKDTSSASTITNSNSNTDVTVKKPTNITLTADVTTNTEKDKATKS